MKLSVGANRFLSVSCEPGERVVYDRERKKYHLLRGQAATLWDEVGGGGAFEVEPPAEGEEDPIGALVEAGLVEVGEDRAAESLSRRVWLRRTGRIAAGAVALPLVATIATPRLVLGGETYGDPSLIRDPRGDGGDCSPTLDDSGSPTLDCSPEYED